jgi:hypothetical protein
MLRIFTACRKQHARSDQTGHSANRPPSPTPNHRPADSHNIRCRSAEASQVRFRLGGDGLPSRCSEEKESCEKRSIAQSCSLGKPTPHTPSRLGHRKRNTGSLHPTVLTASRGRDVQQLAGQKSKSHSLPCPAAPVGTHTFTSPRARPQISKQESLRSE